MAEGDLGVVAAQDPARLRGVLELLLSDSAAPALVRAAIVHAELALLVGPPGVTGVHGVLGRALEHMVLVQAGVDPRAVLVMGEGHRRVGEAYAGLLADYAGGTVGGVREWIVHCAGAVTHGADVSPMGKGA
ncbi:MAG: hypothetical protein Q4G46_02085 [Propionibacteriaceae bacterium]|nr:hypothetical protein [Propionibacteriaceae bacterium]